MSLASISIISAALILFGVFYLILINLNHNLDILYQQPKMQVYCLSELTDEQVSAVKTEISANKYVESVKEVTKKEAFEQLKKFLETNKKDQGGASALEGYDESIMQVSFIIKIKDPKDSSIVAKKFLELAGVENVTYSQATIDMIKRVSNWVKAISFVLIGLLLIISLFIISNTIKLTVFARRKEINIMKYIGATDWFIRWPFIFEGIIIGILGALIAFVLVAYLYGFAQTKITYEFAGVFAMVKFSSAWLTLIFTYAAISAFIGASGSVISIRKHLHV